MRVVLDLFEIAALVHQFDDALANRKAILPIQLVDERLQFGRQLKAFQEVIVALERNCGLGRQDIDGAQIVALADLKIVEVMRRRNLDRARTGFRIGIIVCNDRNVATDEREHHVVSDQSMVTPVLRVDRDTGVASMVSGRVVATTM